MIDGEKKKEKKHIEEEENRAEPPPLPHHLSIMLSPSLDLRFPHHHLRWRASTTTYTMGGATRRGSGSRRRTAARKMADRGKPLKTS